MLYILNVDTDTGVIVEKIIEETSESFGIITKFGEFILYLLPLILTFIAILIASYFLVIVITNLRMNYRIKNEAFEKLSRLDVFRINQHVYKSPIPKWEWMPSKSTKYTNESYDISFSMIGINLRNKECEDCYKFFPKAEVKGFEQGGDVLYIYLINNEYIFLTHDSIEECRNKMTEVIDLFYGNQLEDVFDPLTSACKRCGCTWNNACDGGCYWVSEWLCSSCVTEEELTEYNSLRRKANED